jgi:energy-coupling factor transporter ATP-binding protein EcfA2
MYLFTIHTPSRPYDRSHPIPNATGVFKLDATLDACLHARGIPPHARAQNSSFENVRAELTNIYSDVAEDIGKHGFFKLSKFGNGRCHITTGDDVTSGVERRKIVNALLSRILPSGTFTHGSSNYPGPPFTAGDLERELAKAVPPIMHFDDRYDLTEDLPDYLTASSISGTPKGLLGAFVTLLDEDDIEALLTTNDPDDQDRLRHNIQARASALATRISSESARLVEMTLSLTPHGLQITMRTDQKKSFYRQMSDATKFLIAYHIHAHKHEARSILLFDEPSRGLHATAEAYLRTFLERIAETNHVVVSTHSEHLLDLDHLDRIRLMQQDDNARPTVLNNVRPPRDRRNYLLALQPVFDAIGLVHANQVLTRRRVILTEGLTDYLYLRAFQVASSRTFDYQLVPSRGEGTLFTLVPFMISQSIELKIIIDGPALKSRLTEAYGISDDAVFVIIPDLNRTSGIEDIFSRRDYARILTAAGYQPSADDLIDGNSTFAKTTNKRMVAQTFLNDITQYDFDAFDTETRRCVESIFDFCDAEHWWTLP